MQAAFAFYCLLTQFVRWFYKGNRSYFNKLGNIFDLAITFIAGTIVVDFMRIDYRMPDLTQPDAPDQLLRAGYTVNYTMQHASTFYGMLLWMLILRLLKFVPHLFGSRHHLFSHTVEKSALDLLAFVGAAAVILVAFTCIFHFTLGTYLIEFATLTYAFYTVIMGLSSVWEPHNWYNADPFTAVLLLLVFTAICTWMLATMVIAIVTESFVAAKADLAIQDRQYQQQKERERAEWIDWVHDSDSGERYRPELEREARHQEALFKRKLHGAITTIKTTSVLARLVGSSPSDRVGDLRDATLSGRSDAPSSPAIEGVVSAAVAAARAEEVGSVTPSPKARMSIWQGKSILPMMKVGTSAALRREATREQAEKPAPKAFIIKGCLWRGSDLMPADEPVSNPYVRIYVQGPKSVVDPSDVDGNGRMAARSEAQLSQGRDEFIVFEEFRSKAVRSLRDKDGPKAGHQAEWNQRFVLHLPGDMAEVRLVIALYDRPGGAALGRETLLSYTIVPVLEIARRTEANADDAAGALDGGGGDEGSDSQRPVLEFTLHPANALKKRSGLNDFLKRTAAGRDDQDELEPKLQLSLAIHKDFSRKRGAWQYSRGTTWKAQRGGTARSLPAPSTSGREPLLRGQDSMELSELSVALPPTPSASIDSLMEEEEDSGGTSSAPKQVKTSVRFRTDTQGRADTARNPQSETQAGELASEHI